MKEKVESFIGLVLVALLVVFIFVAVIGISIFGFMGVVKAGLYFDLVDINLYPNKFSNLLYFGWLLILIFIILIFIEIITRLLLGFFNISQSLRKNILSYSLHILVGTVAIKALIDSVFARIEVSNLSVFIGVFVLYIIVFFSTKGHKGIDDLAD